MDLNQFKQTFGDLKLTLALGDFDPDQGKISWEQELSVEEIFQILERDTFLDWADIKTLTDVKERVENDFCDVAVCFIGTPKEAQARKEEKERDRLQNLAAEFCAQHNVKINSPEFFERLEGSLGAEEDYRHGLKEDGLCATAYPFSSAGYDQWNEMNDMSRGREASLQELWDHIVETYPLTFLAYQEQIARENV